MTPTGDFVAQVCDSTAFLFASDGPTWQEDPNSEALFSYMYGG